jgi:diguanylate cyclase (GGDEF)-like protein
MGEHDDHPAVLGEPRPGLGRGIGGAPVRLLDRRSLDAAVGRLDPTVPYAVAMADLDGRDPERDGFGTEPGDDERRRFGMILRSCVRSVDLVGRDERHAFIVVFPGCSLVEGAAIAHRIRAELSQAVAGGLVPGFTASFGVADSAQAGAFAEVVRLADAAMFRAQLAGKDRLMIADEEASAVG